MPSVELGARTEVVVNRLRAVPHARPTDKDRVEAALGDGLRSLGLPQADVTWIEPASDVVSSATAAIVAAHDRLAVSRRTPLVDALFLTEVEAGKRHAAGVIADAERELKACDRRTRRAVRRSVSAAMRECGGAVDEIDGWEMASAVSAVDASMNRGMVRDERLRCSAAAKAAGYTTARGGAVTWAATADAMDAAGSPNQAVVCVLEAYLPLVDAVEAGLWMFWVLGDVLAVPAPSRA